MDIKAVKQAIRERVWRILEESNAAAFPRPVYGRIPNFVGSQEACRLASTLPEFKEARVIKINPDSPQRYCRELALRHGKLVIVPTPRIKEGFLLLDSSRIPRQYYDEASTIGGSFKWGIPIKPWDAPQINLVIIGSVAVNPSNGRRLGKSHGYAEIEWGIVSALGKVNEDTPVLTTVHELQLVNDEIPKEPFDLPVDIIVTPSRVIKVNRIDEKPKGIYWGYVTDEMMNEIPLLAELRRMNNI
ncbi:5-formyltetrahydrofolate cyclo-ligase [Caldivirga maquilingensis]|uniref:5-formyltetrahydrofolate cyclo-ligase n=1 Tax=Caldivirga maquilingensis (strain ATCC 700844 / DSM 13496 / JCM 10307 / IC-167) TaxID=397948 RepID=A8M8W0_CALMQ|nr:5-formyltetrahydrofolate cyclo-ligase [Caldivirga maquilingensis]ABW02179.1 5-formyltetrahydrofolate cyclo-ligase [Caldivirga maquilingensis IC-167]